MEVGWGFGWVGVQWGLGGGWLGVWSGGGLVGWGSSGGWVEVGWGFGGVFSHQRGDREQVGVVAALLQVHHDVEQRHLVPSALGVQCLKVPRQDELIVLPVRSGRHRKKHERRDGKHNPLSVSVVSIADIAAIG